MVPHCFLCPFHLWPGCVVFLDLCIFFPFYSFSLIPMLRSYFVLNKEEVVFSESLHKVKSHEKPTFTVKGAILGKKKGPHFTDLAKETKPVRRLSPPRESPSTENRMAGCLNLPYSKLRVKPMSSWTNIMVSFVSLTSGTKCATESQQLTGLSPQPQGLSPHRRQHNGLATDLGYRGEGLHYCPVSPPWVKPFLEHRSSLPYRRKPLLLKCIVIFMCSWGSLGGPTYLEDQECLLEVSFLTHKAFVEPNMCWGGSDNQTGARPWSVPSHPSCSAPMAGFRPQHAAPLRKPLLQQEGKDTIFFTITFA